MKPPSGRVNAAGKLQIGTRFVPVLAAAAGVESTRTGSLADVVADKAQALRPSPLKSCALSKGTARLQSREFATGRKHRLEIHPRCDDPERFAAYSGIAGAKRPIVELRRPSRRDSYEQPAIHQPSLRRL